jgi:membrane protease YdiL (CAAX protease family)
LRVIGRAVGIGVLVLLAATIPRNIVFFANLRYMPDVPWAVPVLGVLLWLFWRAVRSAPEVRAGRLPLQTWAWSLSAGAVALVVLVLGLRVVNRFVPLPVQRLPDLAQVPVTTMTALLLMSSLFAGVVEESAFRGFMQAPIERQNGLPIAILITGTMFAVVPLDFTLVLWPYYVAVAAIHGTIRHVSGSILPAVVLHSLGNVYSNFTLWLTGRAEWQATPGV